MTYQMGELFEHQETDYYIVAMSGLNLIPRDTLIVSLPTTSSSTGLYRGYQGTFAVDEQGWLILKYASMPDLWKVPVNQRVPITGHVLFSNLPEPWTISCYRDMRYIDRLEVFEAEVIEGRAMVTDWSTEVAARVDALPFRIDPYTGNTMKEHFSALRQFWGWTPLFLPRHYEQLKFILYNYRHMSSLIRY